MNQAFRESGRSTAFFDWIHHEKLMDFETCAGFGFLELHLEAIDYHQWTNCSFPMPPPAFIAKVVHSHGDVPGAPWSLHGSAGLSELDRCFEGNHTKVADKCLWKSTIWLCGPGEPDDLKVSCLFISRSQQNANKQLFFS